MQIDDNVTLGRGDNGTVGRCYLRNKTKLVTILAAKLAFACVDLGKFVFKQ